MVDKNKNLAGCLAQQISIFFSVARPYLNSIYNIFLKKAKNKDILIFESGKHVAEHIPELAQLQM